MRKQWSSKRSDLIPNLLATALAAFALPAVACGPEFPSRLLEDRATLMSELAEGTFDYEAALLAPKPAFAFVPVENPWDAPGAARIELEKKDVDEAGYNRIEAMRLSMSDAASWREGEGLPQDVRLYTAGARAFHAGQYGVAGQRFAAVLALPAAERGRRGLWAQFMLGRVERGLVGGAGLTPAENAAHKAAATQAYEALRAAVQGGASDPLGLAVASYGEEALMHLEGGDTAAAAALYAQQAALGSESGRASLLMVARDVFADEAKLALAFKSPVLQQLLAAYVYTRRDDFNEGAPLPRAALDRYYAAIKAADPAELRGVDRVAAAAYRSGEFDLAGKLAVRSEAPLALWVRAKLALRAGDVKGATDAYAQASRAFPRDEQWGGNAYGFAFHPACRVDGERAVLALDRGDYTEALRLLHAGEGDYWFDEAYVAERVLSADELKAFVDANVPEPKAPPPAQDQDESNWFAPQPAAQLRDLLGRRLMRAGRYDEAVPYFRTEIRDAAKQYAQARNAAEKADGIERAQQLFAAAKLARASGMEILGTEMDPDHAIVDGAYDMGAEVFPPAPHPYLKDDEMARYQASKVHPEQRFHYRYVAADLANRAADFVPPRSQAFAAVLCSATGWLINRDYDAGRAYYQRYVKQGAYVPWGGSFGVAGTCPAPDFPAAAKRLRDEQIRYWKRQARIAAPWAAGAALVLAVGGLLLWRRRRKPAA